MNDFRDPPTWVKFLLILAVAALIIIGLATMTAPTCDPVTKPARALTEYRTNSGLTIEQATINAAQKGQK